MEVEWLSCGPIRQRGVRPLAGVTLDLDGTFRSRDLVSYSSEREREREHREQRNGGRRQSSVASSTGARKGRQKEGEGVLKRPGEGDGTGRRRREGDDAGKKTTGCGHALSRCGERDAVTAGLQWAECTTGRPREE